MNILTRSKITEHFFEDHLVLLNHTTNQLLVLNPSARLVWQWFVEGHSDEQIIEKLTLFFNIPHSVAEQDVKTLCENWYQHQLLIDSADNKTTFRQEDDNQTLEAFQNPFNIKSLNIYKCYLLANRPFSLRFNEKNGLGNQIDSLFAHIAVPDQEPLKNFSLIRKKKHHILLADGELLFHDPVFENVKGYLVHEILKLSYPNTEWLAMIHAMAVAYGEKAVVMPAPSGYGKSTLAAALLKVGFSYLGDDLVPIQRGSHQITPLLTRLSLKKGSWQLLDTHYPELNELPVYNRRERDVRYLNPSRYMKTRANLPVTALVFPRYQAGQSATLKPISAIESLERLIENEVWLGNPLENDIVSEFLTWLNTIPRFSFEYSELDQAVQKIQGLFSDCL